jgi:hypothetical protein
MSKVQNGSTLVLLPGFQKGREQFWPKRQFAAYKEKLE